MSPYDQEPPQWAIRFLRFYCKPRALEIIEGDAYELFYKRIDNEGIEAARKKFSWDVLRFFRLRYIKGLEDINSLNNIAMIKNYIKISFRSLLKQRFYSLINIGGLAIGLAACLLIVMYISNELSYDKFHADSERIYRIGVWTPARLAIQSKLDIPEIEETTRIQGPYSQTFNIDGRVFKEPLGFNADSTFHNIFSVEFIEGNPDESLKEPNSVILTQTLATKFFGYESAVGRVIKAGGDIVKVTGVVADPPKNSHFGYRFINSYPNETWVTVGNWTGNNFFTYAKFTKGSDPEEVENKMTDFAAKYVGPELVKFTGHANYEEYLAEGGRARGFSVRAMTDLHLYYPSLSLRSGGSIDNVYIFSAVALFILVIACINFMNLSTARSAMRSKEVGMRKVLGSLKGQLINQFLVESMMVSVLSMILAIGLASLTLNGFNSLANRTFDYQDLFGGSVMLQLFGLVLFVGLLAGSYPAFVLSSFKPIKALKGEVQKGGKGSAFLRQGLVAFQFAISIFLIISTVVVFKQLNFLTDQKLGFDAEQVLIVKNADVLEDKAEVFKTNLSQIPSIENMAMSRDFISERVSDWSYETVEENSRNHSFINMFATDDFLNTMGLNLIEGRNFTNTLVSDTATVLINEAAKKWLGWDEVLGRKISRGDGEDYTIVGVVNDFNFTSLKNKIEPMVIRVMGEDGRVESDWYAGNYVYLRVNGNFRETVSTVESLWKSIITDEPFEYAYLDEAFAALYDEEERFGKLFTTSSGLAIIIACLGLFALAAFTLERRFKEIAVRKVLGASISSITLMILKGFTILVGAGALIAIPVGYIVMGDWLQDFAYQISLNNPLIWILPALMVATIAWLTVGFLSAKTAMANPIKALRSE
ncbi:ABC transporter permease [Roseivirga sp. E12]|uniref:ABC transporter permease n=1 Tax=Roseivirga sp. E12 TaxID=2819237 RepID=UPI001ABC28BA|nr:ABC transporter permease [Roseivirga sp. E12]MBO3697340.1 ABC transporter permease [Roseivirga sp. E12]